MSGINKQPGIIQRSTCMIFYRRRIKQTINTEITCSNIIDDAPDAKYRIFIKKLRNNQPAITISLYICAIRGANQNVASGGLF